MCCISGANAHGFHHIPKDISDSQECKDHWSREPELKTLLEISHLFLIATLWGGHYFLPFNG